MRTLQEVASWKSPAKIGTTTSEFKWKIKENLAQYGQNLALVLQKYKKIESNQIK